MLRYYTSSLKAKGRVFINEPVDYFDNTVVSEIKDGSYTFNKYDLTLLSEVGQVSKVNGTNVITKYGELSLYDLSDALKIMLVISYCHANNIDAVVWVNNIDYGSIKLVVYETYDKFGIWVNKICMVADECKIGLYGCLSSPKYNLKNDIDVLVNDSIVIKDYELNYVMTALITPCKDVKRINFNVLGNEFDLQLDFYEGSVSLPYYVKKLFSIGLKECIENGSLMDIVILDEDTPIDINGIEKYRNKIIINLCGRWYGYGNYNLDLMGSKLFHIYEDIITLSDVQSSYSNYLLNEEVAGTDENGFNKYRFTLKDKIDEQLRNLPDIESQNRFLDFNECED